MSRGATLADSSLSTQRLSYFVEHVNDVALLRSLFNISESRHMAEEGVDISSGVGAAQRLPLEHVFVVHVVADVLACILADLASMTLFNQLLTHLLKVQLAVNLVVDLLFRINA